MTIPEPYESYKATTVPWLDALPYDWSESRLGYETWVRARLGWKGLKADEYVDTGFAFLATPNIKSREIDFERVNFITKGRFDESPEIKLQIDDVLLAKDGSTLGTVNVVRDMPVPATVNSSIAVLTPGSRCHGRYVHYLIQSELIQSRIEMLKGGMGVPHLFQDDIRRMPIPLPPLGTQARIVEYLDRETAQIDELIGKQERLIELLAEKRQTIITHAVTKGLDPTAPTKPSGIPWLGDVPASWTVQRTSWVFQTISSGTTPPSENLNYYDGDTNWVTTGELRESEISTTAKKVTQTALTDLPSLRVYSPGALLIAMYGATIGRLGILSAPAATNQACCVFDRPTRVTTRFAFFALMAAKEHLLVLASGGGQPNINQEKLRALRIPVPPIAEQKTIIEDVDRKLRGIDTLSGRSQNVIALLRERRSALISAAVTGKIDVREGATHL